MSFTSIFIPTGAQGPTSITTSGTTQELDPADAPIISLAITTASDVATLPAPQSKSAKIQESGLFVVPKVIFGQYLNIKVGTLAASGALVITTTDVAGDAMTLTFNAATEEIVLVAAENGYAILKNEGVTVG